MEVPGQENELKIFGDDSQRVEYEIRVEQQTRSRDESTTR